MNNPLVTISIPTYNSEKSLEKCLNAIKRQTYKDIEINVIDKCSLDKTLDIAKKYNIEIVKKTKGSLLESRYLGAKIAKGKYILILDSDQILVKNCIERALKLVREEGFSMLALEENTYRWKTIIEKLFYLDRKLINSISDLSPFTGVIMPRFFEKSLLLSAYDNIPKEVFPNTGGPDHAIVYYEAWKIDKKVGIVPDAVYHIEPSNFFQLCPKFFRWGYTSIDAHFGKYQKLMNQKERFRKGLFKKGLIIESIGSICILLLKGIWFKVGYFLGKLDKKLGIPRRF